MTTITQNETLIQALKGKVLKKIPDDKLDAKSTGTFENAKMVRNWTPRF